MVVQMGHYVVSRKELTMELKPEMVDTFQALVGKVFFSKLVLDRGRWTLPVEACLV